MKWLAPHQRSNWAEWSPQASPVAWLRLQIVPSFCSIDTLASAVHFNLLCSSPPSWIWEESWRRDEGYLDNQWKGSHSNISRDTWVRREACPSPSPRKVFGRKQLRLSWATGWSISVIATGPGFSPDWFPISSWNQSKPLLSRADACVNQYLPLRCLARSAMWAFHCLKCPPFIWAASFHQSFSSNLPTTQTWVFLCCPWK